MSQDFGIELAFPDPSPFSMPNEEELALIATVLPELLRLVRQLDEGEGG